MKKQINFSTQLIWVYGLFALAGWLKDWTTQDYIVFNLFAIVFSILSILSHLEENKK
jgi:hypothetical protein